MALRFLALALATSFLIPAWPAGPAEAQTRNGAKLSVPITGSVGGGGTFSGTLSLQRFAARGDRVVAIGAIAGVATTPAGSRSGVQVPVELPVAVSEASGGGATIQPQRGTNPGADAPMIQLVQQSCGVLLLEIAGNTTIDLLGLDVALNPVRLEISGDTAGPLGNLVCQALGLLNSVVNLVGLLNQILGLVGNLVGGVVGGVPV